MVIKMSAFLEKTMAILKQIDTTEKDNIKMAASLMYNSLINDGLVHVFATGHSHMFCEELFYRAGGLVGINPILEPFLMQHEGAISSTKFERMSGLAKIIFDKVDKKSGEPFIIVSNSGINAVVVEMAMLAKANNYPVIAVTSLSASKASKNRVPKKLYEIADVVIDNHVPYSDGVLNYKETKVGAVSSIAGSFIAQSLVLAVIAIYEENKQIPPIFKSANTEGGDLHNEKLYQKYHNRIKGLS